MKIGILLDDGLGGSVLDRRTSLSLVMRLLFLFPFSLLSFVLGGIPGLLFPSSLFSSALTVSLVSQIIFPVSLLAIHGRP